MSLSRPPSELREIDNFILYAIVSKRNNAATIPEIRHHIETLWQQHNLKFKRSKLSIPSYTYFYQRLDWLVTAGYIERKGKRTYKLNCEKYNDLLDYIKGYIKLTYGVGE